MELQKRNRALYQDILPEQYDQSWANPRKTCAVFGEDYDKLLAAFSYEFRSLLFFVYRQDEEEMAIRLELFLELCAAFSLKERGSKEKQAPPLQMGEDFDEKKGLSCGLPDAGSIRSILYSYVFDRMPGEAEREIRQDLTSCSLDFVSGIEKTADLTDPKVLYRFGDYISEDTMGVFLHLARMDEEELARISSPFSFGYRTGFETTGKDFEKKKLIGILSPPGFERYALSAISNFEAMGKNCIVPKRPEDLFEVGISSGAISFGGSPNPQYSYDHREDLALILDEALSHRCLKSIADAYRALKDETVRYAGPAVVETFGEMPFSPESGPYQAKFHKEQTKCIVHYRQVLSRYYNEVVVSKDRSFTIISFPVPSITRQNPAGDVSYADVFESVVKINTLDYRTYQRIQGTLIDALNGAQFCAFWALVPIERILLCICMRSQIRIKRLFLKTAWPMSISRSGRCLLLLFLRLQTVSCMCQKCIWRDFCFRI